jgi:uncharacterized BrkB/YihY/UPF0761 family membrane protein
MRLNAYKPLKEIVLVLVVLIGFGALCGIWAYALLLFVELLFGPLDQDGVTIHIVLMSGVISFVLFALRVSKTLRRKVE